MARYYSDMVHQPTCVYRLYSERDDLIYVGLSMNLEQRLHAHAKREWWPEVTRCDVEWFDGREAAKAAERHAIATESPRHNQARPAALGIQIRDITRSGAVT